MLIRVLEKIFGSATGTFLKKAKPLVSSINQLEPTLKRLSDAELSAKTTDFRERLLTGESSDDLVPEAFAVVREASRRVLSQRHFDVQLLGGIALHQGKIAEMNTGEGKTLAATLPAYLNALSGKGVHIVTVNDYLARRDCEKMGLVYGFLGLSTGVIYEGLTKGERRRAYGCDITYGQNKEFGFDYLRDNLEYSLSNRVQRGYNYCIIDEIDSILIDEARTPLIISGYRELPNALLRQVDQIVKTFKRDIDYEVDERKNTAVISERGIERVEQTLSLDNLYTAANEDVLHAVVQSIKAYALYERDVDYVVKKGKVRIVDEFTGRILKRRKWSKGLHQAVEAKEGVEITKERKTLASITYQNYFKDYAKLSGMTGTAKTEEDEFARIYGLAVVCIPPNRPVVRKDYTARIFETEADKYMAVAELALEKHKGGQPILIGTTSIEQSERLAAVLKGKGLPLQVLNARHDREEAAIIAQAGRLGAVTVATNMAGRGTDIMLGGNPEFLARAAGAGNEEEYRTKLAYFEKICGQEHEKVAALGGLCVIATEMHEAKRIDNQLRGRAGRQGDPGSSHIYLSLEDSLMRRYAGVRAEFILKNISWHDSVCSNEKRVRKLFDRVQSDVELQHYNSRTRLLAYDSVLSSQRKIVYTLRDDVLVNKKDIFEIVADMVVEVTGKVTKSPGFIERDNLKELCKRLKRVGKVDDREKNISLRSKLTEIYLQTLDNAWADHLTEMDELRMGVRLRGYGRLKPELEYQRDGFMLFEQMLEQWRVGFLRQIFLILDDG